MLLSYGNQLIDLRSESVERFLYERNTFNFAKILKDRHFVVGGPKDFKLLPDISFDSDFQKFVLSSLLLFSCACY